MIDPQTVQKIKDTADIVEVVSDYVHLIRRGANYMGLCPFHNERTPSFSVSKSRNFCFCFSCKKGGSPISFIMEKEGVSYHEALLMLAKKYNIEVRERELTNEEREQQTRREGMLVANEWAKNYFVANLEKEEGRNVGLSYLYGRNVTPEAIKAFALGYAIDKSTDFTDEALRNGFSLDVLKSVGLTGTSQQGSNYDRFRGRVIFPIINTSGKTIAFGGRDLKGGPAKYVNSPESEVYYKSRELYGIFQAKGDMVRENKCYLVEGYLDVIGMWQSGIRNTVASSGTALTDGQIALIHRFTDNVTLIYDGDAAGIKASLRGIDMLLAHNLNVSAVRLPEGEDPDSLSAKLTPEELKEFLRNNETDIIRFKSSVLLDEVKNDPQKRWMAIRSIVESIAHIADKIKRDIYIQECSQLLDIKETTLATEVAKARMQVVEQEKQKRRADQLQKEFPSPAKALNGQPSQSSVNSPQSNSLNASQQSSGDIDKSSVPESFSKSFSINSSPLFPLEKELLYYCLRFGFVSFMAESGDLESNETSSVTIIELIAEELDIDGIAFSNPDFSKIFEELLSLLPKFKEDSKNYDIEIEEKAEVLRKEGHDKIAMRNKISLPEIKRQEKLLEENITNFILEQKENYSKQYILNQFASHEDDIIRYHTNQAFAEKHQLSSLFTKNQQSGNKEEKIVNEVVTSLNVLKNGIIDLELKELMDQLKHLQSGDEELEKSLHQRIGEIIQMRSRMAKDIGDRIISPLSLKS